MNKILCNLCQSEKYRLMYNVNGYDIVKCEVCGLVYLNPQPSPEELEEIYSKQQIVYNGAGEDGFLSYINNKPATIKLLGYDKRLADIENYIDKGKILDIGCAGGFFLDYAKSQGWDTYGIEISSWAFDIAKNKLGLNIYNRTLREIAFPDNHFDVITMYDILEHTNDPMSELQEVYRVLKPQGLLVINLPNIDSLLARINKSNWIKLDPPQHLYHFTPRTIRQLLAKAGFRVADIVTNHGDSGEMGFQLVTGAVTSLSEESMSGFIRFYRRHKKYLKWLNTVIRKSTDMAGALIGIPTKWLISRFEMGEGMLVHSRKVTKTD